MYSFVVARSRAGEIEEEKVEQKKQKKIKNYLLAERLNNLELSGRLEGCAARDGKGKEANDKKQEKLIMIMMIMMMMLRRGKVVRGAVANVGADKAGRRRGAATKNVKTKQTSRLKHFTYAMFRPPMKMLAFVSNLHNTLD